MLKMSLSKEDKPQAAPTSQKNLKGLGFQKWSAFWLCELLNKSSPLPLFIQAFNVDCITQGAVIGGYFAAFNIWNMRKLDFEGSFQVNALPGEYSWMKRTAGYKSKKSNSSCLVLTFKRCSSLTAISQLCFARISHVFCVGTGTALVDDLD